MVLSEVAIFLPNCIQAYNDRGIIELTSEGQTNLSTFRFVLLFALYTLDLTTESEVDTEQPSSDVQL